MDELVSFETAKLAKEKGSPSNFGRGYYPDGEGPTMFRGHPPIYAPTQTNLQRWLRETHELHVYANYREFADNLDGYYFYLGKSIYQPLSGGLERSDTYEGALEAGLLHALQSME